MLEARALTKKYGATVALDRLDLKVERGEIPIFQYTPPEPGFALAHAWRALVVLLLWALLAAAGALFAASRVDFGE